MFGNKKEYEKRFDIVVEQTINMTGVTVIRDKQTGVNYILGQGVNGFAITPLIDKDGEPLITLVEEKE